MREPNSISGARRARPAGWARALVTPLVAVGLVLGAGPASAGGSTWEADPASVAPGETVTVWAAVAWAHNDTLGTPDDGPYYAYLRELDGSDADWAYGTVPGDAIRVAEIDVVLAPYEVGPWKFGPNHAIFEFVMPDLEPGEYSILHCDDPCTEP